MNYFKINVKINKILNEKSYVKNYLKTLKNLNMK